MKRLNLIFAIITYTLCVPLYASCRDFTEEQYLTISEAFNYGHKQGYGYTLASITIQESFVGTYIVKVNNSDGKYGSYGVTHILLSTAMWLEGYTNHYKAKQDIIPKLINDNEYSFKLSIKKLNTYKGSNWSERWASYNGKGDMARKYSKSIKRNVEMLKRCTGLAWKNRDYKVFWEGDEYYIETLDFFTKLWISK